MRKERRSVLQPKNLLNAQNTEKSVSAIIAAEIFISTSSEEADEAIKLPKLPIISVINTTKHNITSYVGEVLT